MSLTVGVGGNIGSGIFDKARGIGLVVRRPLRDLWHKVPVVEATVKVICLRLSSSPFDIFTKGHVFTGVTLFLSSEHIFTGRLKSFGHHSLTRNIK